MKIIYIILVLLVAVVAVIFGLQNSAAITISLFSWSISGSLSLFLIVTLAIGFLLGVLLMTPSVLRRSRMAHGLKKQVSALEKEKNTIIQKPIDAETSPEHGASNEAQEGETAKKRE
jgi:putative membrane protein